MKPSKFKTLLEDVHNMSNDQLTEIRNTYMDGETYLTLTEDQMTDLHEEVYYEIKDRRDYDGFGFY